MEKGRFLIFMLRSIFLFIILLLSTLILLLRAADFTNSMLITSEGTPVSTLSSQEIPSDNTKNTTSGGKLAIIIDDFGSDRNGVQEMMEINEHLTFAVMPFLQYSTKDAEDGHKNGFEIIVHLSMEPEQGKLSWLGPRPILAGTSPSDIKNIVRDSFESVPYASGANIHMGSKASSREMVMSSVFEIIKERNVYFVDSLTSREPASRKISEMYKIKCYERNIFIDGTQSTGYVMKQLEKAQKYVLKHGSAIAIGHVGTEGGKTTAEAIKEMLPEFRQNNIQLVYISELN